jgi:hypothetical protein
MDISPPTSHPRQSPNLVVASRRAAPVDVHGQCLIDITQDAHDALLAILERSLLRKETSE